MLAQRSSWRALAIPGLFTSVALAILVALGVWQLERRAWKADLIARIEARAYGEPVPLPAATLWPEWNATEHEYLRVRAAGVFDHGAETAVHGLMAAERGRPVQGFYLLTPLRLQDGSAVIVNRGFVPTELKDPAARPLSQPRGEVTVIGLMRAPEKRGWFVPENDPRHEVWFVRDVRAIAEAKGLGPVAPFIIDADATPTPGGWPRGGQTRLSVPNDHLQYALTWFGLALTLIAVFLAFARRRLKLGAG